MVALALLNLVYPGLALFLRREALQGLLYFLAIAFLFFVAQSEDPRSWIWWLGAVWGAAQVHFLRVRHLGAVRPFGRVGRAIIWTTAGLCVLSTLRDSGVPCPPCALTGRPLLDTFVLMGSLLVPAVLLTWGLAPIRWPGWLTARLAPAPPPTPTEQAPLCWVAIGSLNLVAFLIVGLGAWEVGTSPRHLVGSALGLSWVTLHMGAVLALVPMGLCLVWRRTRALPWVLVGLWGAVTGLLLLIRAGWQLF